MIIIIPKLICIICTFNHLQLTIINHGLTTSDTITIADDALIFTCSDDDHFTEQSYPRSTDPASGATLAITGYECGARV